MLDIFSGADQYGSSVAAAFIAANLRLLLQRLGR